MKLFNLIVILVFGINSILISKPKDTLNVLLYRTSKDVLNNTPLDINAILLSDEKGESFMYANKILDIASMQKVPESKMIWAVKYKDSIYVNTGYLNTNGIIGMFVKLDILGTHCAIKFDKRMPFQIYSGIGNYGAGLFGYIMDEYNEHNYKQILWKIDKTDGVPILYCNLEDIEYRNYERRRNESCLLNFLTIKQLKKIKENHPSIQIQDDQTVEGIFKYLEQLNIKIKSKN